MASIGSISFDNRERLKFVAGPCMIESEKMALETATVLKEEAERRNIPLVFKASYDKANRQSLDSARGVGISEGLRILKRIKTEIGLPVLTDIHLPSEAEKAAEVADCLQIPAFLCRQTDLVVAAAKTGKCVNIKKGQFLAPEQMRSIVEKASRAGAEHVLVTERGASFGYNDLVFDPRSLEIMKTFAPVVFDVSHAVQKPGLSGASSSGDRGLIPALARAAVAVGIAGLFLETHPDPDSALSDRQTQWPLNKIGSLLDQLIPIDEIAKRW